MDVLGETHQMIEFSDIVGAIRSMVEKGMALAEIFDALYGLYKDADVQPIEKLTEKWHSVTGFPVVKASHHSRSNLERWHTAATGE